MIASVDSTLSQGYRARIVAVNATHARPTIHETQIVDMLLELRSIVLLEVPVLLGGLIDHAKLSALNNSNGVLHSDWRQRHSLTKALVLCLR